MMKKLVVCAVVGMLAFSPLAWASDAPGPAPNSGDGIPDGSGFDCDYFDCLIGL